jgi:outer membrane immunogenic protein
MKRFVLASLVALAAVSAISTANAADLPRRQAMPTKAPLYAAPYNWTGFYIGINGGGGFGGSTSFSAPFPSASFDTSGGVVGGTIGYNWQMGQLVLGLEGDGDWSDIRGSAACGAGTTCSLHNDWLATGRGRIGYAFDRFMPYFTGGAAFGNVKTTIAGIGSSDDTKVGWTVGGGIEANLAGPWSAKIEYLYADLGDSSSVLGSNANFRTNLVRGGINYRF